MMRRVRRHRQPLDVLASLNITNLIDTAFILLITFMLVAPQLTHGIKLDLPEVTAPILDEDPQKVLEISITRKWAGEEEERIYLNGKVVTLEDVYAQVEQERARRPNVTVVIRADDASSYGMFARVAEAVQRAGVADIGLEFRQEPSKTRKKSE